MQQLGLGSAEKKKEHELMGEGRSQWARDLSGHPTPQVEVSEWGTSPAGQHIAMTPKHLDFLVSTCQFSYAFVAIWLYSLKQRPLITASAMSPISQAQH